MTNRHPPDSPPPATRTRKRRPKLSRLVVSAQGVARLLSCGVRTVRTWDYAGKLPRPVKIGTKVLWSVDELRHWVEAGCPDRATWEILKAARN